MSLKKAQNRGRTSCLRARRNTCGVLGSGVLLTAGLFLSLCSVEGEAPSSETGTSLDSPAAYHQGPLAPGSSLSPDHYEHTSGGAYGLYSGPPGQQQRTRRPKLQHSTSILRKQAEEEAIKRSRSLSESYELSSDLQDKQVGIGCGEDGEAAVPAWPQARLPEAPGVCAPDSWGGCYFPPTWPSPQAKPQLLPPKRLSGLLREGSAGMAGPWGLLMPPVHMGYVAATEVPGSGETWASEVCRRRGVGVSSQQKEHVL